MAHWMIAPILLPVVLAALMVAPARHRPGLQRALSLAGAAGQLALALALVWAASQNGPALYRLGDWPAPFGIMLVLDRLSALMLVLSAGLSLIVLWQAIATGWDRRGQHFHALLHLQVMGLNGAFLTADAFNLFVFFEVLLIASYGLMIHGAGAARLKAGLHYMAVNLIGSAVFLLALSLLYALTGTLNMADLAQRLAALPAGDVALARVGAVLLLSVFALKGALVPLQFWLPGTYANAPGPVAALFAILTKVGAYATIRMATLIFPPGSAVTGALIGDLLFWGALVTILIGSAGVLGSRALPRLAAFCTLASMGTLFLAVAQLTEAGLTAAMFYMVHSTLAGAMLFLLADALGRSPHPRRAGGLAGLYLVAAMALVGLPPLSGFAGKLLVLQLWPEQAALVWAVMLAGTFLMLLGFARAGSDLFWKSATPGETTPAATPGTAPIVALATLLLALSLLGAPVMGWMGVTAGTLTHPQAYIALQSLAPPEPFQGGQP